MIPLHRFLRRLSGLASGAALLVLATASAAGADFSVNPLSVMLDAQARSAQIEIRNHADQPVRFQIRGAGWTQDAAGKNVYGDLEGLIYFYEYGEWVNQRRRITNRAGDSRALGGTD